jgi:hypothetical protein
MRLRHSTAALPLIVALAGCGTIVSETFQNVGEELEPTVTPTQAATSGAASASAEPSAGTFRIVNVGVVDGPGTDLVDAIERATGDWDLVNGTVLMDLDGTIWFCETVVVDVSPPTCSPPRLRVVDWPEGTADWDLSQPLSNNLQEAEGVLWQENFQLVGIVEP